MTYIERFAPAFPASRFEEPVTQYALYTLGQLNDSARLFSYGEKVLASNPNSMPTMLMLRERVCRRRATRRLERKRLIIHRRSSNWQRPRSDADKSRKVSAASLIRASVGPDVRQEKTPPDHPNSRALASLLKARMTPLMPQRSIAWDMPTEKPTR